jgi:hypothetical protein
MGNSLSFTKKVGSGHGTRWKLEFNWDQDAPLRHRTIDRPVSATEYELLGDAVVRAAPCQAGQSMLAVPCRFLQLAALDASIQV